MTKKYSTLGLLNKRQAESLHSKLMYSIENISNCFLDGETQEIVVDMLPNCDEASVDETIRYLIEKEKNNRIIGARILKETEGTYLAEGNRKSYDIEHVFSTDGSVRRPFAVLLAQRLDAILLNIALRHQAEQRAYSSKISLQTLNKCKYLTSFPQNLHFVGEIPHALKTLEQVKKSDHIEDIVRLSPYALTPAVCFHCYAELSGHQLNQPVMLTALGVCHRHEASWRVGKHRLSEFSVREIALFGDNTYINEKRTAIYEEAWEFFRSLGFAGKIENASDPFYFSEDSAKRQHQIMGNMKYELVVDLGEFGGAFSVSSSNDMGDSLCKSFEIHDKDGKPLNSGCVGFGIDRWVYALLSAYGPESDTWPPSVKKILSIP